MNTRHPGQRGGDSGQARVVPALVLCIALAGPLWAASVDQPETWDAGSTAGWVSYDLVNERPVSALAVDSDALELTYKKQSMRMPPEEYLIRAGPDASGGRFVGNYVTNHVVAITFRFCSGRQADINVELYSAQSERLWRYRVPAVSTGTWVTVKVPVDPDVLYNVNGRLGLAAFREDLEAVSWVGISVRRNSSMSAQVYRIDDFTLAGVEAEFTEWMSQFTTSSVPTAVSADMLPEGDLDGDAMSNFSEWVAGTSAGDPSDSLELRVGAQESEAAQEAELPGITIRWPSAAGRRYRVLRATDLVQGFEPVGPEILATPPENTFRDLTADGEGPYYYKVSVMKGL